MADYDLKLALNKLGNKRLNFALFKGDKADQVIISPKPASAKLIASLEKESGALKRIAKGVCFQDGDTLVFATKSAPAPSWVKMLTTIFKEQKCAKFLPLIVRQLGDNEADEVSEEEESNEAQEQENPPEAPVQQAPAEQPNDSGKGEWLQLKARLTPLVPTALASNPNLKAPALALVKQALEQEKAGNFAEATQSFQKLESLLSTGSSGVSVSPNAPPPPPPPPQKPKADPQAIAAELKTLIPQIKGVIAADPSRKDELLGLAGNIQNLLKGGQAEQAQTALGQLSKAVAPPTAPSAGVSVVKLGKARLEWTPIRTQAIAGIGRLQQALSTEFADDDEQKAALQSALGKLDSLIQQLQTDLESELDLVLNEADPQKRLQLAQKAKTTMANFVKLANTDPIFQELDGNEVLPDMKIVAPLQAKLAEIATALG